MRELRAAVSFLTRVPIRSLGEAGAAEVARGTAWFPLVGLFIGAAHVLTWVLLDDLLPPAVVGICVLAVDVLLTGGLHMDGLADSADGFGGGRDPGAVLDIMRDHAIGTYGALALILVIGLKWSALVAIVTSREPIATLLIAPVLGRWAGVTLAFMLPYARSSRESTGGVSVLVEGREWALATITSAAVLGAVFDWRAALAGVAALLVTFAWAWFCRRRIHGTTGDTLGAGIVLTETVVFVVSAA